MTIQQILQNGGSIRYLEQDKGDDDADHTRDTLQKTVKAKSPTTHQSLYVARRKRRCYSHSSQHRPEHREGQAPSVQPGEHQDGREDERREFRYSFPEEKRRICSGGYYSYFSHPPPQHQQMENTSQRQKGGKPSMALARTHNLIRGLVG